MSLDKAGGPPKRRQTSDEPIKPNPDLDQAEPAPPIPVEIGQESPNPLPDEAKPKGGREREHTEDLLDHGLDETFPASDPVSIQGDR
jgi:hypothetical protein